MTDAVRSLFVLLPVELATAVENQAAAQRTSKAEIVRRALGRYFDGRVPPFVPRVTARMETLELVTAEGQTKYDLAEASGKSPRSIERDLTRLIDEGLVVRISVGRGRGSRSLYALPS